MIKINEIQKKGYSSCIIIFCFGCLLLTAGCVHIPIILGSLGVQSGVVSSLAIKSGAMDDEQLSDIALSYKKEHLRLAAIKKIDDEEILTNVAINLRSGDQDLLKATLDRISNKNLIAKVAIANDSSRDAHRQALEMLNCQELIAKVALESFFGSTRLDAIRKLNDQKLIAKVAIEGQHFRDRKKAIEKLHDMEMLLKIASDDNSRTIRDIARKKIDSQKAAAIEKITDQEELAKIVMEADKYNKITATAIKTLIDQDLLADIAIKHNVKRLRVEALQKLSDRSKFGMVAAANRSFGERNYALNMIKKGMEPEHLEALIQSGYSIENSIEGLKAVIYARRDSYSPINSLHLGYTINGIKFGIKPNVEFYYGLDKYKPAKYRFDSDGLRKVSLSIDHADEGVFLWFNNPKEMIKRLVISDSFLVEIDFVVMHFRINDAIRSEIKKIIQQQNLK